MGENAWKSIQKFGYDIQNNYKWLVGVLENSKSAVNNWFTTNLPKIGEWGKKLISSFVGVNNKVSAWISNPSSWGKLITSIQTGFSSALATLKLPDIKKWLKDKLNVFNTEYDANLTKKGDTRINNGVKEVHDGTKWVTSSNAFGSPGIGFSSLGKAVAFENKHKPPGSSLVVANSSETIIPAAKGYIPSQGMYSRLGAGMSSAPIRVSAPITIHQQPGQDSDELASMVAMKIGDAVAQARSASVFV
jgi:hypothetical protein